MTYYKLLSRVAFLLAFGVTVTGCSDGPTDAIPETPILATSGPSLSWNQTARELIASRGIANPPTQIRILTYLSVAQYNAILAAENAPGNVSPSAASAAASLVVLESFFPLDSALLEEKLRAQKASQPWPEQPAKDAVAGDVLGKSIGAQTMALAATDNTNLTTRPVNPGGPGNWTGVNSLRGFYQSRTWALTSGDQFLPASPPAFKSAEYNTALAEVRAFSDGITPAQLALSQSWNPNGGAFMNGVAAEAIVQYKRTDREAARILVLANMAGFDVANACFDAKFFYYYIRPSQADPQIKLPNGLPNHPSYPSGHSCFISAYAAVLSAEFPLERDRLTAMTVEAGNSRMYAGLHYRFDCVAGQELGRKVAEAVLSKWGTGRVPVALR